MKTVIATLKSATPYSQSRPHESERLEKESPSDYDARTWREHLHCDDGGNVVIPANVWKVSLSEAAQFLSKKIKGKGNATYTKHFDAGVVVAQDSALGIKKADVPGERLFLNADGKRGGNKRVWRTYPVIHSWKCDVEYVIGDDTVTRDVFEEHLDAAGKLIGIGRWRPRNRGRYGRFEVIKLKWT